MRRRASHDTFAARNGGLSGPMGAVAEVVMAKRAGLVLGILALGVGCDFEPNCGPLQYNRSTDLCECPMAAPYDVEAGGCVLPDGGVIAVDGGPMGGGDAGAPPTTDACTPSAETCNGLDDDCDGDADEAAASAACQAVPGATRRACTAGACVVVECASGRDDCNGEYADGCEAELATDDAHCGGCGLACEAGESCEASACEDLPRVRWLTEVAHGASSAYLDTVDVADDGSICVGGTFSGTFSFVGRSYAAAGPSDVFVARLSGAGAIDWIAQIGGAGGDFVERVAVGVDGTCIVHARAARGAAVVAGRAIEVPSSSATIFARISGVSAASPVRVLDGLTSMYALRRQGDALLAATFVGAPAEIDETPLPEGWTLVRFDATTLVLDWARLAPAMTLTTTADRLFVAGSFTNELRLGSQTFVPSGSPERHDVLVSEWTLDGELVSAWQVGRDSYDFASGIDLDASGAIRVAGQSYRDASYADAVFWTVATDGAPRMRIASSDSLDFTSVGALQDGLWTVGRFQGTASVGGITLSTSGGDDIFVASWSEDDGVLWARAIGSSGADYALARRSVDGVVLAGSVDARFSAGGQTIEPVGSAAAFVMLTSIE